MNIINVVKSLAVLLFLICLQSLVFAQEPRVIEEWWYPLRFDSVDNLVDARYKYRQHDHQAAAHEINKAASWLVYSSYHANPLTKTKLEAEKNNLMNLSVELEQGKELNGTQFDHAITRASVILSRWLYNKATVKVDTQELKLAIQIMEVAAMHLRFSAFLVHYQFNPAAMKTFESIRNNGRMVYKGNNINTSVVSKDLGILALSLIEMEKILEL